jgi:hypothetical protein
MKTRWFKMGAMTFAAFVLAALMAHAAVTTGCSSRRGPGASSPDAEDGHAAPQKGAPASDPGAAPAPGKGDEDEDAEESFLPASKAGPIFHPKRSRPGAKPGAAQQAASPSP